MSMQVADGMVAGHIDADADDQTASAISSRPSCDLPEPPPPLPVFALGGGGDGFDGWNGDDTRSPHGSGKRVKHRHDDEHEALPTAAELAHFLGQA